ERYGVPAHEILQRAGELGYVGGQEDMIIDIAVQLAQERDLAATGARWGRPAMEFVPHVIDGQEIESASGERFTSTDPWTREPWAEVALGGADDADRAVQAARRAFDQGPP